MKKGPPAGFLPAGGWLWRLRSPPTPSLFASFFLLQATTALDLAAGGGAHRGVVDTELGGWAALGRRVRPPGSILGSGSALLPMSCVPGRRAAGLPGPQFPRQYKDRFAEVVCISLASPE